MKNFAFLAVLAAMAVFGASVVACGDKPAANPDNSLSSSSATTDTSAMPATTTSASN